MSKYDKFRSHGVKLLPCKYYFKDRYLKYVFFYKKMKVCSGHFNFTTEYFNIDRIYKKDYWTEFFLKELLLVDYKLNAKSIRKLQRMEAALDTKRYEQYLKTYCNG